jgi:hypothetical protein
MAVIINSIGTPGGILSPQEQNLVDSKEITRYFGLPQDFIQLYVYNTSTNTLLNNIPNFQNYTLTDNKVINLDPEKDITNLGYRLGTYNLYYNFLRPIVTLNSNLDLFIQNISQDRTEIKIATTVESNDIVYNNALTYIDLINSRNYFLEFYLDLGSNNLITANSFAVEKDINGNVSILVKLFNALPDTIVVNSPLNLVEEISETQGFEAIINQIPVEAPALPSLRQANFSLNVDDQRIGSSDYYNFNQLTTLTGSNNPQLQNLLGFISSSNPTINVDYTDYNNFTHFGSQTQRLSTFKTKVQKLELYNNYLPSSSLDNIVYQNKINEIIKGFDGYETYLYFESTSFAWPKSNTQPPFNLYSSTSPQAINWYNLNYTSASYYDEFNNNNLVYGLPVYIQEKDDFENLKPFIHSMGQMFDDIWIYIRAITDIWKAKNNLMDGISKDLVGDALQSLGISLYTDGDQDDLATYLYGVNQSGSYTFMPQPWQTAITASNPTLSGQDEAKSVFKRIYANLPTLLKSKGTTKFINYLTTLYGIPDTVLVPLEFGGVDKDSNTIEYSYPKFTYALSSSKTIYTQLILPNSTTQQVQTLEFRFKPYPSASTYTTQSLFSNFPTGSSKRPNSIITLNGSQSGSYQYGTLSFYSNDSGLSLYNTPLQVTLPFYVTGSDGDYNWWNVVLERNLTSSRLYVKSELSGEIGHQSSSFTSTPVNSRFIETGSNTYLGTIPSNITASLINAPFYNFGNGEYYGQFQELKAYNNFISESVINIHTLNPESYIGNNSSSAYNDLLFRFPLGNDLQISGSKITGSQPTLNSNILLSLTGSLYIPFTEMYYSQPAIGGYSVPVTNKIRIVSESLASNTLQFNKSVVYPSTSSRTFDVQTAQVGFSPQDQINNDIIAHLGNTYNLDDIIGDPSTLTDSNYEALTKLQENYFTKYNTAYNYKDFLILMETFHKSLFRYLNDFTPARTDMSSGIIIKPHILERNKVARHEPSVSTSSVYYGGTTMVSISGSNPGDYCCSRNLSYNESFYTGDISGSYIDVNDTYEQHNPFLNNPVTINRQFFNQQYSGWNALDNNVSSSLVSQFKFKKLKSSESIQLTTPCVRYKLTTVGHSLGPTEGVMYRYVDCNNTPSYCNQYYSPGTLSPPTVVYVPAKINSVVIHNGTPVYTDPDTGLPVSCPISPLGSITSASFTTVEFNGYLNNPTQSIYSLKQTPTEFQDTLLTETSFQRSRIDGVKSTAPSWNQLTTNTNSSSSFINVEYTTPYMLFYDWTSNTLAERQGSNNFHIRYLIDETGKIFKPESSGSEYYSILEQGFGAYAEVDYVLYNATYYQQSSKPTAVHRPLKTYNVILYSETGSLGTNYLQLGFNNNINFEIIPNVYDVQSTNLRVNKTDSQSLYNSIDYSLIYFNNIINDNQDGWNLLNSQYNFPQSSSLVDSLYKVNITSSLQVGTNTNGIFEFHLIKNGNVFIPLKTETLTSGGSPGTSSINITYSDFFQPEDFLQIYYERISGLATGSILNNSYFEINTITSGINVTSSYFYTSDNINLLSNSFKNIYSLYSQTPINNSGFSQPLPFTLQKYDQIRFEGNESKVYTIMEVEYIKSNGRLRLQLDRTFSSTSTDINNFSIRRLIDDPGFIMLDTQNSQGPGFILPKFPTPTLKKNFSNIVQDLASKNLLT